MLLLLAILAATTTLTLGLVLRGVTDDPYQSTRDATAGPDVVAAVSPPPVDGGPSDLASLEALIDDARRRRPQRAVPGGQRRARDERGDRRRSRPRAATPTAASVDQPELTEGSWVRDGGVVVEAAFADALGVHVGDRITLDGRSFRVVGVAVTAAIAGADSALYSPPVRRSAPGQRPEMDVAPA